jgi:endonuclease G
MALRAQTRRQLDALVRERLHRNTPQIEHSLAQIASGNPLGAEPERERALRRMQAKGLSPSEAEALAAQIKSEAADARKALPGRDGREAVWGQTLDFLDVSFFHRGRIAADAVARVAFRDSDRPQGTGLLAAPGLLLTNNHVIENEDAAAALCAQFRYEQDVAESSYGFRPEACFVSDSVDGLDFTLIALGERMGGDDPLDRFGFAPLSDASDKHMLGEVANIIQHPQGRRKQIVLRENQLVGRDELARVLHYVADTEPGSSGSPVFNNSWEVIALHHWGGPWLEGEDLVGAARDINEGIRISAIVKFLKERARGGGLQDATASAVQGALALWEGRRVPVYISETRVAANAEAVRRNARDEDFTDRGGYEPGFLPGHIVPLPKLARSHTPARNVKALIGQDRFELPYHHFSIVMNAERRLAYFTACNIDGSRLVHVDRRNKTTNTSPTPADMQLESAEASDDFRADPRVDPDEQMTRPFYEAQKVRGFPDPQSSGRIARMFQKGHIIMRGDPAWGSEQEALDAERDTFFYTNAAPQVGYFNQGSPLNAPGTKGKLRWRAVETYVLRNALTMRERVSVFAGPIFAADDPEYRFDARVPMRFWKIAAWVDDEGALRSIALIADQTDVLKIMPERAEAAEAFLDDDELARVSQFLTTVEAIQDLTGLDFGAAVRNADVRQGQEQADVLTMSAVALKPRRAGGAVAKKTAKKARPRKRRR